MAMGSSTKSRWEFTGKDAQCFPESVDVGVGRFAVNLGGLFSCIEGRVKVLGGPSFCEISSHDGLVMGRGSFRELG